MKLCHVRLVTILFRDARHEDGVQSRGAGWRPRYLPVKDARSLSSAELSYFAADLTRGDLFVTASSHGPDKRLWLVIHPGRAEPVIESRGADPVKATYDPHASMALSRLDDVAREEGMPVERNLALAASDFAALGLRLLPETERVVGATVLHRILRVLQAGGKTGAIYAMALEFSNRPRRGPSAQMAVDTLYQAAATLGEVWKARCAYNACESVILAFLLAARPSPDTGPVFNEDVLRRSLDRSLGYLLKQRVSLVEMCFARRGENV